MPFKNLAFWEKSEKGNHKKGCLKDVTSIHSKHVKEGVLVKSEQNAKMPTSKTQCFG